MLSRDIPLFKLDLTGQNPDNFINAEYYRRDDLEHDIVFVMRAGPFYTASLVLTTPDETVLVENEDYEIYGIASRLTAFAKDKEVGMMIKMLNTTVSEWFASYQVMGHFSILNEDLVHLIDGALNDSRPLYYRNIKNKPLWFDPTLHLHDIRYDIHSFGDLIDIIQRIPEIKKQRKDTTVFTVEHFYDTITERIEEYETMLLDIIKKHDSDNASPLTNSHGLTATQVGLGNVDNFDTATLLDALDGFRQDLHLSADNVKLVMEQQNDANKTLYPFGVIPLLRYGQNSFIPSPIQGSYEGMGGNDFRVGVNIEPNGEWLILGNRNDGRVNSLYFMRSKDITKAPHPDSETGKTIFPIEYTAYAYVHQTANTENVDLRRILRGSNGKFLILGGDDSSGKEVWYYTLGNGTFDPLKHVLKRIPSGINVNAQSILVTEGFPDRILLFTRQTSSANISIPAEYRDLVYETPTDATNFPGANFTSEFIGYWGYEYRINEQKWRKINFNYTQVGRSELISSRLWAPFKFVVEEVSATRPRADGANVKYGLSAGQYYFSTLITFWNMRAWYEAIIGFYNANNDKYYLKVGCSSYGQDGRTATFEGGGNSMGIVLSNRVIKENDEIVDYSIENRKGLTELYTFNSAIANNSANAGAVTDKNGTVLKGTNAPLSEYQMGGYAGTKTICMVNSQYLLSIGSANYATFPATIMWRPGDGLSNFIDYDRWVDTRIDEDTRTDNASGSMAGWAFSYNETNPVGLSIGMHSVFWTQLDLDDVNSFGSIAYGNNGQKDVMVYRKQAVLKTNGCAKPPETAYDIYNRTVTGYPLDNTTYHVSPFFYCYCTNIFWDASDNRRNDYYRHIAGAEGAPRDLGSSGYFTTDRATTQLYLDWKVETTAATQNEPVPTATFVPTKILELRDILTNVLIPTVEAQSKTLSPNVNYLFNNALATYRIGFTHLRSTKYDQLMIFACYGFSETTNDVSVFSVAFNLTGGTADSDGVIQGAKATIVGNVTQTTFATAKERNMLEYRQDKARFYAPRTTGQTQARDVVKQLENGMSFVNLQWNVYVDIQANLNKAGTSYLVSEDGIIGSASQTQYWTPGEYRIFHHPYYGLLNRSEAGIPPGAVQVGLPYQQNPTDIKEAVNIGLGTKIPYMGYSNYLDGNFTIIFATDQTGLQNGNKFTLASGQKDLNEVVSDPRNKTFYIYLDYNENGPYYNISLTPQAETASRSLLSIVKTNNESIYEIVNYNVMTMNGIRVSIEKKGSVIPAASGSIYETGQIEGWVTNNRS